ncbi:MAG: glycosyltransferase, partial [Acidobacteriota bacterium]|nr:glycosyltransferase [Acidobacteriota bacterium]
ACGTPVVALGRGGALETVVPGETGVLFPEPTVQSLRAALDKCAGFEFNKSTLRSNAMKFSRESFKGKISSYILEKWADFKKKR